MRLRGTAGFRGEATKLLTNFLCVDELHLIDLLLSIKSTSVFIQNCCLSNLESMSIHSLFPISVFIFRHTQSLADGAQSTAFI